MSFWAVKNLLVFYDDMATPPPLALAITHPLVRAAVESNTDYTGCGVFQACGLHVSLRPASEDGGFGTYHSVLESVTGQQLGALVDTARAASVDISVHRPEDDDDQGRDHMMAAADHGYATSMDCHAAVPLWHRATVDEKAAFYASSIRAPVVAALAETHDARSGGGRRSGKGAGGDVPLAATAPAPSAVHEGPSFVLDGLSAAAFPPQTLPSQPVETSKLIVPSSLAPAVAARPFFTEATPRAALPPNRRVLHAVHAPRIPHALLDAMAWWLWRPSTTLPLEYIGSAFLGPLPVTVHDGATLATLFTKRPSSSSSSSPLTSSALANESEPHDLDSTGGQKAPRSFAEQPHRPSLVSLRLRGFIHLRTTSLPAPRADLAGIAAAAPQLQLLQLTGLHSLRAAQFRAAPRPFHFLFHLDISNTRVLSLDFVRRFQRQGDGTAVAVTAAGAEAPQGAQETLGESPFPLLRVLNISGCYDITTLAPLEELPELVVLVATRADSVSSVAPLSRCRKLEEVDVSGCGNLLSLAPLAQCRVLRSLRAAGCQQVKTLGLLLRNSATTGTLEYLNVSRCPLITSIFGFDQPDMRVPDHQLQFAWLEVGGWRLQQGFEQPGPVAVEPRAPLPKATTGPDAFSRTALRYINISATGIRLQTAENLLRIGDVGELRAHEYPSHTLHWISVLCPQLEQLNVSGCAARPWQAATAANGEGAVENDFETRLREATADRRTELEKLQTVDLSPLLSLKKLRKLVVRGLKRVSFTAPTTQWCMFGCRVQGDADNHDEAEAAVAAPAAAASTTLALAGDPAEAQSKVAAAVRAIGATQLRWLDMDGSALALPLVITPKPRETASAPQSENPATAPLRVLDDVALNAQLARDVTVQWLRLVAHAFVYLYIPAITTTDPLDVRDALQWWCSSDRDTSLDETLRLLVMTEIWKPTSVAVPAVGAGSSSTAMATAAAANPFSRCITQSGVLGLGTSPSLTPQTPYTGFTNLSSASWGTAQSGMLSGISTSTFPMVSASSTANPGLHSTAASSSAAFATTPESLSPLTPYETAVQYARVTTRFLTHKEATQRDAQARAPHSSVLDPTAPERTACRVPFAIPAQIRRLTLSEPEGCPSYARSGAVGAANVADAGMPLDSPVEEDDIRGFDGVMVSPEDVIRNYGSDMERLLAARYAVPLPNQLSSPLSVISLENPSLDASCGVADASRSFDPTAGDAAAIQPLVNWSRVVRRVDVGAFSVLLQCFPFVEEITFDSCTRSLRSLTPIFCLPRLWATALASSTSTCASHTSLVHVDGAVVCDDSHNHAENDDHEDKEVVVVANGDKDETRRRALFEVCARALPHDGSTTNPTTDVLGAAGASSPTTTPTTKMMTAPLPTREVVTPYLTYSSLRVLNASFASRLTSLGPLAQCCPLLERLSLRNCLELRSLRGLWGARQLRFLDARVTGITSVVELARHCPSLVWVDISGCRKLTNLDGLSGAPMLRYLRACRLASLESILDLSDDFYAAVEAAAGHSGHDEAAVRLPSPHFPQLVELDLTDSDMLTSLASLGLAPRLERCIANSRRLVQLPLARIQCPSLVQLGLCGTYKLTTLAPLSGAPQLRELVITVGGVSDVSGLAMCPLLCFLELKTCKSLQSVAALAGAPALSHLGLENSDVLDISGLERCPALEYINVGGCAFLSATRPRAKTCLATTDDAFAAFKETASVTLQHLRDAGVTVQEEADPMPTPD